MCFGRKKDKNDKNRMKFEKEYPERAAEEHGRRRKSMERVYAGPGIMPRFSKKRRKDDDTEMKDVYGGPEYFERLRNNDDTSSMGAVYAGPDTFESMNSDDEE